MRKTVAQTEEVGKLVPALPSQIKIEVTLSLLEIPNHRNGRTYLVAGISDGVSQIKGNALHVGTTENDRRTRHNRENCPLKAPRPRASRLEINLAMNFLPKVIAQESNRGAVVREFRQLFPRYLSRATSECAGQHIPV